MTQLNNEEMYSLALDKVRRFVFTHSNRLLDFMKPFDKLNHGLISVSQFHRAMSVAGITLSDAEAQCLAKRHELYETGEMKYREFCEEVNQVFRVSGLEENPYIVPPEPGEALLPVPEVSLEASEMALAKAAVEQLRLLTKTRKLNLRAFFAPFDKHNTGKITLSEYERAFPIAFRENKFTEEEVRQLGQLVSTNDGLVDCNKLRFLIEGPPAAPQDSSLVFHGPRLTYEKPARTNKNNSQFTGAQPGTASARSVTTVPGGVPPRTWAGQQKLPVQKIETAVAAGQLPLRESFRDFDGLEKGVCTKDQAHAVLLSVLRINLSECDWEGLLQQFVRADGMFAYDALCSQIEASLGNPEAQQYPTRVVPVQTPSELRSAQEDKTPMTQEELVRLRELQERLSFKVKQTRKVLLPTFQDFDKRCTQHVTRRQLWRILGMLDLPVNEEELNLLCLWLCDKGNLQEIAYRPLLRAIDPPINGSSQQGSLEEISESVYYRDGKVVPMAETLSRIKQH